MKNKRWVYGGTAPRLSFLVLQIVVGLLLLAVVPLSASGADPAHSHESLRVILESFGLKVRNEDGGLVVEATLPQILTLAMERNLSLESVRVNEMVAQSVLRAARDRLHPTLTNTLNYGRSRSPLLSSSATSPYPLSITGSDSVNLSAEYSQPLGNGMSYGLTYTEKRLRALSGSFAEEGGDYSGTKSGEWIDASELKGAFSIPIYQDYGSEFQNLPVRRGELGLAGSRVAIRSLEQNILELTASTYWDLVATIENVNVQREAVALSRQLLEDNRQRLKSGVISPFDVRVTETQLALEQELLLNARSEVARIEDQARAILNLEVAGITLSPLEKPRVRTARFLFPELLEKAYRNSNPLRQLEADLSANALDLDEVRNDDLPNLDLELNYTLTGYSESPAGGISGFGEPGTDSYGATLTWKMPLFDVTTREKIQQRKLERTKLELDITTLRSELTVRLQGVLRQIRLAKEEVATAGVSRNLAEEQLKNEIVRMQVGESTSFQVAQFQQDASAARVREILAQLKYERNFLGLLLITGEIYNEYGITPTHP